MAKKNLFLAKSRTAKALSGLLRAVPPNGTKRVYTYAPSVSAPVWPWCVRWSDNDSQFVVYIPERGSVTGAVRLDRTGLSPSANGVVDWFVVKADATDFVSGAVWAELSGAVEGDETVYTVTLQAVSGTLPPSPSEGSVALFRLADVSIETFPAASVKPDIHTVRMLIVGAVSLGGGGEPSANFAPGYPEIVREGVNYFEVYYFGRIDVTNGVPKMTKLDPPVEAYRVQVVTHAADHTNGVVNGPL